MSEGAHAYHKGVDYKEHHGTEISLLFGQEMAYIIGSENKTIVGMESKLNIGAVADVGLATKVELEFGAEVKWVNGWHFVMAAHGGGVFDDAFSVTAGSKNLTSFKSLKVFLSLAVLAQVIAAGASAGLITTEMAPHKNASGHIEISGNSGFFWLTTVNAQVLSLTTLILTIALKKLLEKQANITPISAMSINNQGYGFLGVSATKAGGAVKDGSSGLALSPNSFTLSFDTSTRDFKDSHHGHEAIGFKTAGSSVIKGDENGVSVASNHFQVTTTGVAAAPAKAPTAQVMLVPGGMATLTTSTEEASAGLQAQPNQTELFLMDNTSGGARVTLAPKSVKIYAQDKPAAANPAAANPPGASSLGANPPAANPPVPAVAPSFSSLILDDKTATLEMLSSSAKVSLSSTEATLSFGNNSVKIDKEGISLANGELTILSPKVPIPDETKIKQLAAEQASIATSRVAQFTRLRLSWFRSQLEQTLNDEIANVIREVETKIGKASVKEGAT